MRKHPTIAVGAMITTILTIYFVMAPGPSMTLVYPNDSTYLNSSVNITYDTNGTSCYIQLGNRNMSYPLCSNTTLTYVHANDSSKVLAFDFAEGTGTTSYDRSVNQFTATHNTSPSWVQGKYGMALQYDDASFGTGDFLQVASGPNLTNRNFSIAVWVNRTSTDGDMIYGQGNGTGAGQEILLLFRLNGSVSFELGDDIINTAEHGELNKWHFLVATFNASNGNMSVYKNGTLIGTMTSDDNYTSGPAPVGIGADWSIDAFFEHDGQIDELAVWNRTLTSTEVQQMYDERYLDGIHELVVWANNSGDEWTGASKSFTIQPVIGCGSIVNTSINIIENLECNGTALSVGMDNVMITGQGKTISGNNSGNGILISSKNGAAIRNLVLTNFSTGINATSSDLLNVTNTSFHNMSMAMFLNNTNTTLEAGITGSYNISGRLTITGSGGKITFLDSVNQNGTNLSSDIKIGNNWAYVNSTKTGLNVSANITLYNPTAYPNPIIFRDGHPCPATICTNLTPLNASTVTFNVTRWSNHSVGENVSINVTSPANTTYDNSTMNITYNVTGNWNQCKIQLNGVNMSYPLCSNTTLTYVHFNDTNKTLAFDFAEGTGTTAYDRGKLAETATFTSDPYWNSSGKEGYALSFDGNDDIRISRDLGFDQTNEMTIAAWVYVGTLTGWQTFVGQDTDNANFTDGAAFYFQKTDGSTCGRTADKFNFQISNGTDAGCNFGFAISDTTPAINTWYHVVGTFNQTHISIYVNGELENITSWPGQIQSLTGDLNIGSGYFNGAATDFMSGSLDEVVMWNRSLSAQEVSNLYNKRAFDGSHQLTVWANNSVGEWASNSVNFTIDLVPTISISNPGNTTYGSTSVALNYAAEDDGTIDSCWYSLNGGANTTLASCANTTITASNGLNNITVYTNDTMGNIGSSDTVFFTVINISIQNPQNTTYWNSTIPVNFTTSFSPDECKLEVEGINHSYPVCANTTLSYIHANISGKVLALDFAEGAGSTTYDRSSTETSGSLSGTATFNSSGKYGQGMSYPGSGGGILIGSNAAFNANAMTIMAWINTNDATDMKIIDRWKCCVTQQFLLGISSSGAPYFWVNYDGGQDVSNTATASINDGEWHHVVASFDNNTGNISIYVDGELNFTETKGAFNLTSVAYDLRIGSVAPGETGNDYNGNIDEVALFNRSLTASEINAMYNEQSISGEQTLTIYANDTNNAWASESVNFTIQQATCGLTINASTTLTENYACNGTAFIVGANDIHIKGAGYQITGNGTGSAIEMNGFTGVTISNTQINNFSVGVNATDGTGINLSELAFSNNTYDVRFNNTNSTVDSEMINSYNITGLLTVTNYNGSVAFLENVQQSGNNLSTDIIIANRWVYVNSSQTGLNKSANVTFNNPPTYTNPTLYREGVKCPQSICTNLTLLNASPVIFNVTGWSNHSIGENITIDIGSPLNQTYTNNTIDVTYNVTGNRSQCLLQIDGVNLTYRFCSNTTLSYVHANTDGKVLAFDFANGSGSTAYDRSVTGKNGGLSGTATFNSSGKYGQGMSFPGSGGGVQVGSDDAFNGNAMTVMAWINTQDATGMKIIDRWKSFTARQFLVGINSSGVPYFWVRDDVNGVDDSNPATSSVNDGNWHHVAATYDNNTGNISVYVDGIMEFSEEKSPGNLTSVAYDIRIGSVAPGEPGNDYNGSIDEFALYNRSLSASEIYSLYAQRSLQGTQELVVWVNDSENNWRNSSVNFYIPPVPSISIQSPTNSTYTNSTINITYNASNHDECKIQLNGVNMSYPLCSNTTLSYVHFNDTNKILGMDFAEGTGSATYDRSTYEYTGSFQGDSVTWNDTGRFGRALTFGGSTDYVSISGIDMAGWSDLTVAAWVYYDSSGSAEHTIISNWDVGDTLSAIALRLEPADDTVEAFVRVEPNTQIGGTFSDITVTPNEWHLVTMTFNSTHLRAYVDGQQSNTSYATSAALDSSSSGNLYIGNTPHISGDELTGSIDEVIILNRTLTAEEVGNWYDERAFDGSHQMTVWVNNSAGVWTSDSVNFSVAEPASATLISPENTTYTNSTINITYNVSNQDECRVELNGVNMSYPLCSNTTLTYVHMNDSKKLLAMDFSEGTGSNAYDRSILGNDASLTNITWNTSGKYGTGLTFDGTGRGTVTDDNSLDLTENFSIGAWVYRTGSQSSWSGIVTKGAGGEGSSDNHNYLLGYDHGTFGTGGYMMIVENSAGTNCNALSNDGESTGSWDFIVGTFDTTNDRLKLYVNGAAQANVSCTLTPNTNAHDISIGDDPSVTGEWQGSIDEVVIWNRTLTASEIQQMYNENRFSGSHEISVWANNSGNTWVSDSVNFTITGDSDANITLISPENATYANSSINITYNVSDQDQCKIQLRSVNYSYPLCSNTSISYIHSNSSSRFLSYDFAEGTGTIVYDRSGNNATAGHNGNPTYNTSGKHGMGLSFDGNGDYLVAVDSTDPTAYTLAGWVYIHDNTTSNLIVRTTASGPGGSWSHQIRLTSAGKFEAYTYDGGLRTVTGSTDVQVGQWYHVASTAANSGNLTLYVNGQEEGTADSVGTLWTSGDRWYIGSSSSGYDAFNGTIDDVLILHEELNATEIANLYNGEEFAGTQTLTVWANDTNNISTSDSVTLTIIPPPDISITSPTNTGYPNTTINLTYDPDTASACYVELNGVNMSYPLCSNTTLTYVHFNDTNKVAAYDFAAGTGSTAYDRFGFNNGTFANTAGWNASGKYGNAVTMVGSSDRVDIGMDSFNSSEGTITVWIRPRQDTDTYSGNRWVFGRNAAGNNAGDIALWFANANSDRLEFFIQNGSATSAGHAGTLDLAADTWYFITGTWNSTGTYLYINGSQMANSGAGISLAAHGSTGFAIAQQGDSTAVAGESFPGNIDEVAIYNRSMNTTEIERLYNASRFKDDHILTVYGTGIAANDSESVSFSVSNPPTISTPTFNPTQVTEADSFACNATPSDDLNSTVAVEYKWYNYSGGWVEIEAGNATGLTAGSNQEIATLGANYTAGDNLWNCSVRTFDGGQYSEWSSTSINISPINTTMFYVDNINENFYTVDTNSISNMNTSDNARHFIYMTFNDGYIVYNITLNTTYKVGNSWNITSMELMTELYEESGNRHVLEVYDFANSTWIPLNSTMSLTETEKNYDLTTNFSQYFNAEGSILVRFRHNNTFNANQNNYEVVIDYLAVRLNSTRYNSPFNGTGVYDYNNTYVTDSPEKYFVPAEVSNYTATQISDNARHYHYNLYPSGYLVYNITLSDRYKTGTDWNLSKLQLIIEGYQESGNRHNLEIWDYTNTSWKILDNDFPLTEIVSTYNLTTNTSNLINNDGHILIRFIHDSLSNANQNNYEVIIDYITLRAEKETNAQLRSTTLGKYDYSISLIDDVREQFLVSEMTNDATNTQSSDNSYNQFYMTRQGGFVVYNLTVDQTHKVGNAWNISEMELVMEGYQQNTNVHNLYMYNYTDQTWILLDNGINLTQTLHNYSLTEYFSDSVNQDGTVLFMIDHNSSSHENSNTRQIVVDYIFLRTFQDQNAQLYNTTQGSYNFNYSYVNGTVEKWLIVESNNFTNVNGSDNSRHTYYMKAKDGDLIYNIEMNPTFKSGSDWNITRALLYFEGYQQNADVHDMQVYNFTGSNWVTINSSIAINTEGFTSYDITSNFSDYINNEDKMLIKFYHDTNTDENSNTRQLVIDNILVRTTQDHASSLITPTDGSYESNQRNVTGEFERTSISESNNFTSTYVLDSGDHAFYMTEQNGTYTYRLNVSNTFRLNNGWNISSLNIFVNQYQENADRHHMQIYDYNASTWRNLDTNITINSRDHVYYNVTQNFSNYVNVNGTMLVRYIHFSPSDVNSATRRMRVDRLALKITKEGDAMYYGGYNEPMTINLTYPENNTELSITSFNITYNVTDNDSTVVNCSLYVNDSLNSTNSSVTENYNSSFQFDTTHGSYLIEIRCFDSSPVPVEYSSGNYSITINEGPIINSNTTLPTPYYNASVVVQANVTDEDVSWVNFTITAPNGTTIVDNVNGTQSGDLWNSTSIQLDLVGQWNYTVVTRDSSGLTDNSSGYIRFLDISQNASESVEASVTMTISGRVNYSNTSPVNNTPVSVYVNGTSQTPQGWFDSQWFYRKQINITELNGTDHTDMQVKLTVDTSTLIGDGKMNGNCSDIRFADENGAQLDYWIQSGCNTTSTVIWTKTNLSASTNNSVYVYYGNPSAEAASNITETFVFGDDFDDGTIDTSKWQDTTGFTELNGYLNGSLTTNRIRSLANFTGNYILETRTNTTTEASNGHQGGGFWGSTTNGINVLFHPTNCYYFRNDGTWNGCHAFTYISQWVQVRVNATGSTTQTRLLRESDNATDSRSYSNSGLSQEWIALGKRNDDANTGQTYQAKWDWIFVRKYATIDPLQAGTGSEENGQGFTNSSGHYTLNITTPDTEGQYDVIVNATADGQYGQATATMTVSGATTITISSPQNVSYNSTNISLNYTATDTDGIDSCWYTLDGGANTSLAGCTNVTFNVSEGTHNVIVYANDTEGNIGNTSVFFTAYDIPTIIVESPQNTTYTDSNVALTYNTTGVGCTIELNDYNNSFRDCANSTLSYVHYNDSGKVLALDFATASGSSVYDRTTKGIVGAANASSWNTTGYIGGGITFNGSNEYIQMGNDTQFQLTGNMTIMLWMYRTGATTWAGVVGKSSDSEGSYGVGMDSSAGTKPHFFLGATAGNSWNRVTSTRDITANTWTHVAVTYNGSHATFFLDGVNETAQAISGSSGEPSTYNLEIGRDIPGGDEYFQGSLDEILILNRTLTVEEVRGFYNETRFNGSHTLTAYTNNSNGYVVQNSTNFTVNQVTDPIVVIISPSNTTYSNTTINLTYNVTNQNSCNVIINTRNVTRTGCWNTTLTYIHLDVNNQSTSLDFSEGSGSTAYDWSGNDNNATITNAVYNASGRYGYAMDFDGDGDYVDVPVDVTGDYTYMAWVKVRSYTNGTGLNDGTYVLDRTVAGNPITSIRIMNGNFTHQYRDSSGSGLANLEGGNVNTGEWQHLAWGREEGNDLFIYVDGVKYNNSDSLGTLTPDDMRLGMLQTGAGDFDGLIDEVAVYNRSFSASEIRERFNAKAPYGRYNLTVEVEGTLTTVSDKVNFTIAQDAAITLTSPQNTSYRNSTIDITYNASNHDECKVQLNGVNMSYPLCSNTTLTYVHMNDSSKVLALDFAEGTGTTTYDRSTISHQGSVGGTNWNTSGRYGKALTFDGIDDHVNFTSNVFSGGQNVTLMAWIKANNSLAADEDFAVFVGSSATGAGEVVAYLQLYRTASTNYVEFVKYNGAWSIGQVEADLDDGEWHHVAYTHVEGGGDFLYIDGVNQSFSYRMGGSQDLQHHSGALTTVGYTYRNSGEAYFNGSIDEVAIWNRTLTASEIGYFYQEAAYPGTHTMKIYANNTVGVWQNSSPVTFTVNGFGCNPRNGLPWVSNIALNCSVTGANVAVPNWTITSGGDGIISITNSNITYSNLTYIDVNGLATVSLGQGATITEGQ